jgi:hypothetical protein
VIPPDFASGGGQSSTFGGLVQLYSAGNPAFLNSINNPNAPTAGFTGVSNPLGLSINNAFGRPWPANAPYGLLGIGSSTILDPAGEPLAGAPNPTLIGGVYAGNLTNRVPQAIPGALNTGAVETALLGLERSSSRLSVRMAVSSRSTPSRDWMAWRPRQPFTRCSAARKTTIERTTLRLAWACC